MVAVFGLGLVVVLFLAYSNGANDNFKGVATLFGSGAATFRGALGWATITTLAGSLVALILAEELLATFSGKGLVPNDVIAMRSFPLAVGLSAATTVMLATKLGFPISTTHALTGALVGAGWLASPSGVNLAKLGSAFFVPLLASPFIALTLTLVIYPLLRAMRARLGVQRETCVCLGTKVVGVVPAGMRSEEAIAHFTATLPVVEVGTRAFCTDRYRGNVMGVSAGGALDAVHYVSAGVVSFARGLNDTPKIAAILLAGAAVSAPFAIGAVAVAMALGGLLNSRKVAETMSLKVTHMNPGQGLTANLVTGLLVTCASRLGVPVSTTHVSCGALFGIGTVTGQANGKMIASILLAWVTTLPVAALLGGVLFSLLSRIV